ncbi:Flocculin type 3 repeat-domain-containing protein [Scheffersomyces coipomensis]|uniref:Flocculin type 3 repeat-domain-containing protein n=1 Tax=Scheffersomyces coipomensis TaxID=1788519 RepID=UPI00315DEEC8
MKFTTSSALLATVASFAVSAQAAYSNATSTVTDIATTVITITSCSEDLCKPETVTTGLTTVTEGTTIYTTYCPLSGETETETAIKTTVVTITSCSENKCSPVEVTTGLTTVTEGTTIYTTYCPLSGETTPVPAPAPTTTPVPTTTPKTVAAESTTPKASTSPTPEVTTLTGGANAVPIVGAGLLAIGAYLI